MERRTRDFDLVFTRIEADLKAIRLDLAEIDRMVSRLPTTRQWVLALVTPLIVIYALFFGVLAFAN
jgi:hypothetical protein